MRRRASCQATEGAADPRRDDAGGCGRPRLPPRAAGQASFLPRLPAPGARARPFVRSSVRPGGRARKWPGGRARARRSPGGRAGGGGTGLSARPGRGSGPGTGGGPAHPAHLAPQGPPAAALSVELPGWGLPGRGSTRNRSRSLFHPSWRAVRRGGWGVVRGLKFAGVAFRGGSVCTPCGVPTPAFSSPSRIPRFC